MSERLTIEVNGVPASYLTAGDGPEVLLLHGTYWSRVWLPVIDRLATYGVKPVAIDLPGCGRSGGELTIETGAVPQLAAWVERFASAIGAGGGPLRVAGHDIGGAVAQHLTVRSTRGVKRLALVNSVSYDSWPVPGVAKFRDREAVERVSVDELLSMRRTALIKALAREAGEDELTEYLSPWTDRRVATSWMHLAGAADSRYTLELMDDLRRSDVPKLLVWGEDDEFQPVTYAERLVAEVPRTQLVRVAGAGHIPMENDPDGVAAALGGFFDREA